MKNRKRTFPRLSILLAACLLFAALAAGEAFAAGGVTVSVSSAEGAVGEEVRVSLRVEKNPGVRSLSFTLGYDPAVLEPTRASYGEAFGSDYATPVVLSGKSPIVFNRVFREENKTVGAFAEVTFRILSAPAGETALTLARRGETGWTVLANGAEAEMTFSGGTVTLRAGDAPATGPAETQDPQTETAETGAAETGKTPESTPATAAAETGTAATDGPKESAAPGTETGPAQSDPPAKEKSLLLPILILAAAAAAVVFLLIRQKNKKT